MFTHALILGPVLLLGGGGDPGSGGDPDLEPTLFQGTGLSWTWKDGLRYKASGVEGKIGGRIQHDVAYIGNNSALESALGTPLEDGSEFRRSRIYFSGEIQDHLEYKVQYDFAGGDADFKDAYLGLTGYDVNVRFGQFKEPFSLEEITSSNYIDFMERSLANVFAPARSTGVMVHGAPDGWTWAAGLFRDSNSYGDALGADAEWNATGRVTWTPWNQDDGQDLLHVGISASFRSPAGDTLSLSQRPESHIAPSFLATTPITDAEDATLLGFEAAWVLGQFSLQGEFIQMDVSSTSMSDPTFNGFYVQGSFFLTEDHKAYDAKRGAFGRVKPNNPMWSEDEACGAWEVKARYSNLDFTDTNDGELNDIGVGVNWYLTSNTKVMLEAINADLDNVDNTMIVQCRMQVTF